jgi:Tol biopolymer transport system component
MSMSRVWIVLAVLLTVPLLAPVTPRAAAFAPANEYFWRTWARHDKVVADRMATRTWMWGPEAFTGLVPERYQESPGGTRQVQYFDKSRMEITSDPSVPPNSIWYVTNGLLARELITGRMQTGDNRFEDAGAARVNVAGDPDDANGPTYSSFAGLLDATAGNAETAIRRAVRRDGTTYADDRFAAYGIGTTNFVSETRHWIAVPFWEFMTSRGLIFRDGQTHEDAMFESAYYATGLPITEAYWARVKVAGVVQDVLMQCFERHCLTYTPSNAAGWEVEMGNVGRHYYAWRYDAPPENPQLAGEQIAFSRGIGEPGTADGELLVANADGTGELLIARGMSAWPPSWSPDGQWMTYAAVTSAHYDIFVASADGTDVRRMTYGLGNDDHPLWSPGGGEIIFVSDADGDADIYRMEWDGDNLLPLTSTTANEGEIAWSPDGSKIAYTTYTQQGAPISIMTRDGRHLTTVTDCHGTGMNYGLTWSPDGTMLAFSSSVFPAGKSTYLCVVNANGQNPRQLAYSALGDAGQPSWSPDSRQLAFAFFDPTLPDPSYEIRLIDADGSDARPLVRTEAMEYAPAWSPDGAWVAYQSDLSGSFDIWVARVGDGATYQVTSGPDDDTGPMWRP